MKRTQKFTHKSQLFIYALFLILISFSLQADKRPTTCTAKKTHSDYSACVSTVMTVIGPQIALVKYDFLGAILAYGTQWGYANTKIHLKKLWKTRRPCGCIGGFPSGHMVKYAAASSFLHYRYGWQYGLPAYVVAFAASYDRVRMKSHSWRDLIASFAIINLAQYILIPRFTHDVRYLPDWLSKSQEPKVIQGRNQLQFRPVLAASPNEGFMLGFNVRM